MERIALYLVQQFKLKKTNNFLDFNKFSFSSCLGKCKLIFLKDKTIIITLSLQKYDTSALYLNMYQNIWHSLNPHEYYCALILYILELVIIIKS